MGGCTVACRWAAMLLAMLVWLGGAPAAAGAHYPDWRPAVVQDERIAPFSVAERERMEQTLAEMQSVRFKVALVETTGGEDPSRYIEQLFASWPLGKGHVLIVYAQAEGRLRVMSGVPAITGEMISRHAMEQYVPRVQEGRLADGILALAAALHAEALAGGAQDGPAASAGEQPPAKAPAAPGEGRPGASSAPAGRPAWGWLLAVALVLAGTVLFVISGRDRHSPRG